uniref:Predicted protein n=1 Tax=Hordeum vulgare subsp. vulgare TaxID=112509 RepID=F2DD35_HORVV|nr:predicted protein [Hordeum vulgare subsp. vulgare]
MHNCRAVWYDGSPTGFSAVKITRTLVGVSLKEWPRLIWSVSFRLQASCIPHH